MYKNVICTNSPLPLNCKENQEWCVFLQLSINVKISNCCYKIFLFALLAVLILIFIYGQSTGQWTCVVVAVVYPTGATRVTVMMMILRMRLLLTIILNFPVLLLQNMKKYEILCTIDCFICIPSNLNKCACLHWARKKPIKDGTSKNSQ